MVIKDKWCTNCCKSVPGFTYCGDCGTKLVTIEQLQCSVCKKQHLSGKFCSECGNKLVDVSAVTKKTYICVQCSKEYDKGKFCLDCGTKLTVSSTLGSCQDNAVNTPQEQSVDEKTQDVELEAEKVRIRLEHQATENKEGNEETNQPNTDDQKVSLPTRDPLKQDNNANDHDADVKDDKLHLGNEEPVDVPGTSTLLEIQKRGNSENLEDGNVQNTGIATEVTGTEKVSRPEGVPEDEKSIQTNIRQKKTGTEVEETLVPTSSGNDSENNFVTENNVMVIKVHSSPSPAKENTGIDVDEKEFDKKDNEQELTSDLTKREENTINSEERTEPLTEGGSNDAKMDSEHEMKQLHNPGVEEGNVNIDGKKDETLPNNKQPSVMHGIDESARKDDNDDGDQKMEDSNNKSQVQVHLKRKRDDDKDKHHDPKRIAKELSCIELHLSDTSADSSLNKNVKSKTPVGNTNSDTVFQNNDKQEGKDLNDQDVTNQDGQLRDEEIKISDQPEIKAISDQASCVDEEKKEGTVDQSNKMVESNKSASVAKRDNEQQTRDTQQKNTNDLKIKTGIDIETTPLGKQDANDPNKADEELDSGSRSKNEISRIKDKPKEEKVQEESMQKSQLYSLVVSNVDKPPVDSSSTKGPRNNYGNHSCPEPKLFEIPHKDLLNETITVHFYVSALQDISDAFNKKPYIYCSGFKLGNWKAPCVEMSEVPNLKEEFTVYHGKLVVPKEYLEYSIEYKYYLLDDYAHETPEILYGASYHTEVYRNRMLIITREQLRDLSSYYQVDDLIMTKPDKNSSGFFKKMGDFVKGVKSPDEKCKRLSEMKFSDLFIAYTKIAEKIVDSNTDLVLFFIGLYNGFLNSRTKSGNNELPWHKLHMNTKCIQEFIKCTENQLKTYAENLQNKNIQMNVLISSFTTMAYMGPWISFCKEQFFSAIFKSISLEHFDFQGNGTQFMVALRNEFPDAIINLILKSLRSFWKKAGENMSRFQHSFWYPLVMIHFLSGDCEMYGKHRFKGKELDRDYNGLDRLHNTYFESKLIDTTFDNLKSLKNSLQMDRLLQTALTYLMKPKHFTKAMNSGLFDDRLVMQMIIRYIHENIIPSSQLTFITDTVEILITKMKDTEDLLKRCNIMVAFVDLLVESSKKIIVQINTEYFMHIIKEVKRFYHSIENSFNENHEEEEEQLKFESLKSQISKRLLEIGAALKENFQCGELWSKSKMAVINGELKLIQELMFTTFEGVEDHGKLRNIMASVLHRKIAETYQANELEFVEIYSKLEMSSFCDEIESPFQETCANLLHTVIQKPDSHQVLQRLSFRKGALATLCEFFITEWKKNGSFEERLNHCLTWPPMKSFLLILDSGEINTDHAVQGSIKQAFQVMHEAARLLMHGDIPVELLEVLLNKEKTFLDIGKLVRQFSSLNLKEAFQSCRIALTRFKKSREVLNYFVDMCEDLPIRFANLRDLSTKLHCNIQRKRISEISYPERFFECTEEFLLTMTKLYNYGILTSHLYRNEWQKTVSAFEQEDGNFMMHVSLIIQKTLDRLKIVMKELISGNIATEKVQRIITEESLDGLLKEFKILIKCLDMTVNDKTLDDCLKKIQCVFKIHHCIEISSSIMHVSEKLDLKGTFHNVRSIQSMVRKSETQMLGEINDEILYGADQLIRMSKDTKEVLKAVVDCLNIITWLKTEIKGSNEIKVFVELMSNAVDDESNFELDRVAYFEASCIAFSPIIFGLNHNSDFNALYSALKETAKYLRNDPDILKKLRDSNRCIAWFKQAKKSQGSVATKSLMEAKDVNRSGKYVIGNLRGKYQFIEQKVTVDQVISLVVDNANGNYENNDKKELSLDDINDLQSRLMLVGGDSSENSESMQFEKDYFLKTSEVINRFASVFVSLCEAGDISVLHYKREIICDIETARTTGLDNYFDGLQQEISELENRLQNWGEKLLDVRKEYPLLNYYTIKQCLFLQNRLHVLTKDLKRVHKLEPQVFNLLKAVAPNVEPDKTKIAFMLSNNVEETANKGWRRARNDDATNFTNYDYRQLMELITTLQEQHDIDENVALASLIKCDPFDESKAVIWCRRHEEDEQVDELADEAEKELKKLKAEIDDEPMDVDDEDEEREITAPFLPPAELGKFLKALYEDGKYEPVQRNLPKFLNADQPSLIILPKDEIFHAVLDLYLGNNGAMPGSEEILLCDEGTSLEQIKLLMLRAVCNDYGIYSLVFADCLGYDVCEKSFLFLQQLMKQRNSKRFVVYCSSENENRSYLVSALDNYHVKMPPLQKTTEISKMLQRQLCMRNQAQKDIFAARVDKDYYNTRVISSTRGGMGKSSFVTTKANELETILRKSSNCKKRRSKCEYSDAVLITIPIHGTYVDTDDVIQALLLFEEPLDAIFPRIYHFDIAPTVSCGVDNFIFNLIVLRFCQTINGKLWRRNEHDLCIIETTIKPEKVGSKTSGGVMLRILPMLNCISPMETYKSLKGKKQRENSIYDKNEMSAESVQRVCQYLQVYQKSTQDINSFHFKKNGVVLDYMECLRILMRFCGVSDPSWMELANFISFFNQQLEESEKSVFTSSACQADLRGFKLFVIRFLLEMSKDFSSRSLADGDVRQTHETEILLQIKRRWEQSFHPYLFFNQDRITITFLGFNVDDECNLVDSDNQAVIQENIMSKDLYEDLTRQMKGDFNNLKTDYQKLERLQKIALLCRVMGVRTLHDPDPTYELTIDNTKKILAIHMRLRCGIPVILMGETGCGKTRLIRFMCELRAGEQKVQNMLLVKVHGGVNAKTIHKKVKKAKELAAINQKNHGLSTILFLDEANTTDAIGLIKEIMTDKRVYGKPLSLSDAGLEVIAACNPYRRHSNEMIKKLESAGLGYHVSAESTYEKIGDIPLRQLVYRVHPLPESMKPLVWDFGQLNQITEQSYAKQIICRYVNEQQLPDLPKFTKTLVQVLAASQDFMRKQEDECSFVSLRDVERAVQVTAWFYVYMDFFMKLLSETVDFDVIQTNHEKSTDRLRRSLILALGVCYVARLEHRDEYMNHIIGFFVEEYGVVGGLQQMKDEIWRCQEAFVNQLDLEDNIAKNQALCENVFMMVICIELRIPLFVVGKPGSSKSLAKTIVQDNMQGSLSKCNLFQRFKQIHMSSYQCSPLSTAESIIRTFNQCSRFQEGKDLNEFTSVVVLDEVGLAEDSPHMPLKALHPLLEDGTDGSEELILEAEQLKSKRVAFIGISNWALDPAKMNRGIMLCRGKPNLEELVKTAREICGKEKKINPLLRPLAEAYLKIYEEQKDCPRLKKYNKKEFFGLRDFYSLIKMTLCFGKQCGGIPSLDNIEHVVKRNFSGLDEIDVWKTFRKNLIPFMEVQEKGTTTEGDQDSFGVTSLDLVRSNISKHCPCYDPDAKDAKRHCTNVRYLLVMTEEYSALPIIEDMFLKNDADVNVIFGSSFPKDQEFAQICRDINRIKMCMETGRTVILLNMESLYESLYDALNQYYVYLGGKSYVDLGLGTHRVKCRVHEDFKLIVIADKDTVYKSFPIPLINRLEKHYVVTSTCMLPEENVIVNQLKKWAKDFSTISYNRGTFKENDAFISFNEDTCASIVIQLKQLGETDPDEIFEKGKRSLLNLASPDALARLNKSKLPKEEAEELWKIYFEEQNHLSLHNYLEDFLQNSNDICYMQVTTFSRLLSTDEINNLQFEDVEPQLLSLMQFQTEQSFRESLKSLFQNQGERKSLIIIQCRSSNEPNNLVACAQHICKEVKSDYWDKSSPVYILFLLQLNHNLGGFKALSGTQSSWSCIHIDELREPNNEVPYLIGYAGSSISSLFDWGNMKSDVHVRQILQLVKGCIQSAMRELNDLKNMSTEMIAGKIKVIADLLEGRQDVNVEFVKCLMGYVNLFLLQKENQSIEQDRIKNWVQQEAIEQRHLPDYGTFREALMRCVEDKITPILTAILKQIDENDNLLILKKFPCLTTIWVDLFTKMINIDTGACNENNFIGQKEFGAKFPFSLQIVEILENDVSPHINPDYNKIDLHQINQVVFSQTFGEVLKDLDWNSIVDYISDMVHLKFTCTTELGYEVLSTAVRLAAQTIIQDAENREKESDYILEESERRQLDLNIPVVHVAFIVFEKRFKSISALFRMNPELESKVNKRIDPEVNEMIIDILTLKEALNYLVPTDNVMNNQQMSYRWICEVKEMKNIVKQVFQLFIKKPSLFGDVAKQLLQKCRSWWTKIHILQLYIDHVCPPGVNSNKELRATYKELWKILREMDDDLSSIESWKQIEDFLKKLLVKKTDNKKEKPGECIACQEVFQHPVTLPCYHVFCYNCADSHVLSVRACPICSAAIPAEFTLPSKKPKQEISIFGSFMRRCSIFFVELVTEFCFAKANVNDAVLNRIMTYAFKSNDQKTKRFFPVQDYALDPTPTIRSFILQQLLNREEEIENQIGQCFQSNILYARSNEDKWNICKLFVNCYEDHRAALSSKLREGTELNYLYVHHITTSLDNVLNYFSNSERLTEISVTLLKNIGIARECIAAVVTVLAQVYLNEENITEKKVDQELKKLFGLLAKLVLQTRNSDCHMFLLRQIIRRYGNQELKTIVEKCQFDWLELENANQGPAPEADNFLVYGKNYQDIREQLTQLMMKNAKAEEIAQYRQQINTFPGLEYLARLTMLRLIQVDGNVTTSIIENVFNLQDWMVKINGVMGNIDDKNLQEILLHFLIVLEYSNKNSLINLYILLMKNPAVIQRYYLPTMPSDNFEEVANARPDDGTGWVPHSCPRGHVYFIGNCGRAATTGRCPYCQSPIGGTNHQLLPTNKKVENRDLTRPGHSLGVANNRSNQPYPERELSPLSVSIQRLLVHLAMMCGFMFGHQQAICDLIEPRIAIGNVSQFLLEHIRKDLQMIAKVFAKSSDDTDVIVHLLFKHILNNCRTNANPLQNDLSNKEARRQYEMAFHKGFVETFINRVNADLNAARRLLMADTRIESNQAMRRLYELDAIEIPAFENINPMHCVQFWEYRQPITLEHFELQVNQRRVISQGKTLKFLSSFLHEGRLFQLIKDLPGIIQLQELLLAKLNFKIDKETAKNMKIKDGIREYFDEQTRKLVTRLVKRLCIVWKKIMPYLENYGRVRLNEGDHPKTIDLNTSFSRILCSKEGPGRVLYAIIDILAFSQNEFLNRLKENNRDVYLFKSNENDLISYNPDRDLLPLVYAHCDYTLEIGRGRQVDYNFQAIEKHLLENMFFGKPKLTLEIKEFEYTDNVRKSKKFMSLKQQTKIPSGDKQKMMRELTRIADISNALRGVEITIGFLSTTKGEPNMMYRKYLREVLHMDPAKFIPSRKMQSTILLTHLTSAWNMLTVERAKRLYSIRKEPFQFVIEDSFKEKLDNELLEGIHNYLRHVDTYVLLSLLTEYILSELSERDENHADFELSEALEIYEDQKNDRENYGDQIPNFVLLKHIYEFWKLIANDVSRQERY